MSGRQDSLTDAVIALPSRVIFGENCVDQIGALVAAWNVRHGLLVTDSGLEQAGHVDRVEQSLSRAGLQVRRFSGVHENPTTDDVDACLRAAKSGPVEFLVGLGGGSSIDTAKGCNMVFSNGGSLESYRGHRRAEKPLLPMAAIPTTAGTGTEVQSFALIAEADSHQKMACGDPQLMPRLALLDPLLTCSLPQRVTACTGLDALTHSVETAVTRVRSDDSFAYSQEGFCRIQRSLPQVLGDRNHREGRAGMLMGACFAGMAIERSMLGAAHSLANPLTAHYDIAHGHAVGMMLPHVVMFNAQDEAIATCYAQLARAANLPGASESVASAVRALIDRLKQLLDLCALPQSLHECSIPSAALAELSLEAASQWTARFNPRPVEATDLEALYRAAF